MIAQLLATAGMWIATCERILNSNGIVNLREMDLLTVVMHEFGHVLGYDHDDPNDGIATLMDHTLDVGERHSPDGFQSNENVVTDARKGWWKRFRKSRA